MGASQSNYIANAYHVEIQAKVSVDEDLYTRVMKEGKGKFKVGAVGNTFGLGVHRKYDHEITHRRHIPGLIPIGPNTFLGFPSIGKDGQLFVTILAGEKIIADNFPVRNRRNIIVDKGGYIQNAKIGKIWTDMAGKNHFIPKRDKMDVRETEKNVGCKRGSGRKEEVDEQDDLEDEKNYAKGEKEKENKKVKVDLIGLLDLAAEEDPDESEEEKLVLQEDNDTMEAAVEAVNEDEEIAADEDERAGKEEAGNGKTKKKRKNNKNKTERSKGIFISSFRDLFSKIATKQASDAIEDDDATGEEVVDEDTPLTDEDKEVLMVEEAIVPDEAEEVEEEPEENEREEKKEEDDGTRKQKSKNEMAKTKGKGVFSRLFSKSITKEASDAIEDDDATGEEVVDEDTPLTDEDKEVLMVEEAIVPHEAEEVGEEPEENEKEEKIEEDDGTRKKKSKNEMAKTKKKGVFSRLFSKSNATEAGNPIEEDGDNEEEKEADNKETTEAEGDDKEDAVEVNEVGEEAEGHEKDEAKALVEEKRDDATNKKRKSSKKKAKA